MNQVIVIRLQVDIRTECLVWPLHNLNVEGFSFIHELSQLSWEWFGIRVCGHSECRGHPNSSKTRHNCTAF